MKFVIKSQLLNIKRYWYSYKNKGIEEIPIKRINIIQITI